MNDGKKNSQSILDHKTELTTFETAKMLGVSVRTVQLWVDQGILAAYTTMGGHRRINSKSLKKLLAEKRKYQSVPDKEPTTSSELTTRQVAKLLNTSIRTVQSLADKGVLPAYVTPGGHRRFNKNIVIRLINNLLKKPDTTLDSFSTGEAAKLLNVSISTIHLWTNAELLPCFKNEKGHRRIKSSDLFNLMISMKTQPKHS